MMNSEDKINNFHNVSNEGNRYPEGYSEFFNLDRAIEPKFEEKNPQLLFDCCLIDHSGR